MSLTEAEMKLAGITRGVRGMEQVIDAREYPHRCVCHLEIRNSDSGTSRIKSGTGWFVGRNTVITAAHNIIDHDERFHASSVYVSAGRSPRQGSVWSGPATWYQVHPHWAISPSPEVDLAAVWVAQQSDLVGNLRLIEPGQSLSRGQEIHIAGYPDTLPFGAQGRASGHLRGVGQGRIDHQLPTSNGVSGGPIWIVDSTGMPRVAGIHTHASSPHETEAVLVTDAISQQIKKWRDANP